MDVFYLYTYGTAGWAVLQAAPLLASPTTILTLLSPDVREPTSLEVYFSRSLGMGLITLGVLTVLLSGSVPLSSRLSAELDLSISTDPNNSKAPYALPTVLITMIYHVACAFYGYAKLQQTGFTTYMLSTSISGLLAVVALWIIMFGSSNGRISHKTGLDKRTSGFPFKNQAAHSTKKKGL